MTVLKHVDFQPPDFAELPGGVTDRPGYASMILADGPTAYYRCDDASGITLTPAAGSVNGTMLPSSGSVWTGGNLDQASALAFDDNASMSFDGLSGRVVMQGPLLPTGAGDAFTLVFMFCGKQGNRLFAQADQLLGVGEFECYIRQSTGHLTLRFIGTSGPEFVHSNRYVADEAWHHVAISRSDAGLVQVFVDGVDETFSPALISYALADEPSVFGARADVSRFLDGKLDELAVFDQAISDTRIAAYAAAAQGVLQAP